jgi:hypothetical protein
MLVIHLIIYARYIDGLWLTLTTINKEAASPRALNDGLRNYTSGSVGKPRISPLGDMARARNDHKLGVLTDIPASGTGVTILATEAIVITAHPNEGP